MFFKIGLLLQIALAADRKCLACFHKQHRKFARYKQRPVRSEREVRDGRRRGAVQVIKVKYSSVDGRGGKWRSFKTLGRARVFAQYWVGKNPEIGSTYAVSGDGIGKIEVMGATLADLFGDEKGRARDASPARS